MKVLTILSKLKLRVIVLGWLSLLAGCCDDLPYIDNSIPKLPRKVAGTLDAKRIKLQSHLNFVGVKVISVGQDYLVSIPSSLLFANQSPRLLPSSYKTLQEVSCFLKEFRKIAVTVTSFTGKACCNLREQALTDRRSQEISNYLWDKGIDSRLIFAQGAGGLKPIDAGNYRDCDSNSRIEITFRNAIV